MVSICQNPEKLSNEVSELRRRRHKLQFDTCMSAFVCGKKVEGSKQFVTCETSVWSFTSVNALVLLEIAELGKCFVT